MYRLLAIAKYEHRYVIPAAHREAAEALEESPGCSLDFEGGPGMQGGAVDRQGSDPGVDRELPPHQAACPGRGLLVPSRGGGRAMTDPTATRRLLAACSLLLSYPDQATVDRLPLVREHLSELPAPSRAALARFADWLGFDRRPARRRSTTSRSSTVAARRAST